MAIPRTRPGNYPAILSYGFRPFFLLGALYAGGAILLWLPLFYGQLATLSAFAPVDWHVHEMLFGYVAALVTGFLLTAIPNWTGRLPLQGAPLLILVLLWCAGRVVVFLSELMDWWTAAAIDSAFLLAVTFAAGREIVAGRNWRNLKVLLPLTALLAANVAFHAEAHFAGLSDVSRRLAIGAIVVLIMIIGGRIIPSFTRNWLVRENPGRLPTPFGRFDTLALVLILHIAFCFVPVGFFLAGLAVILPDNVPSAAGLHAFGVGAMGSMTLAVMTRATLGHTGRALAASPGTCMIYAAILAAAVFRIAAAFLPGNDLLLHLSVAAWAAAFLGYVGLFGGMLSRPRLGGRPS